MLLFKLILGLLLLLLRVSIYVVIASTVLTMIRTILRPRWAEHPAIQAVIALGQALCAPARALLELLGISPRPFDFSPLVTIAALEIILLLLGFLRR